MPYPESSLSKNNSLQSLLMFAKCFPEILDVQTHKTPSSYGLATAGNKVDTVNSSFD